MYWSDSKGMIFVKKQDNHALLYFHFTDKQNKIPSDTHVAGGTVS